MEADVGKLILQKEKTEIEGLEDVPKAPQLDNETENENSGEMFLTMSKGLDGQKAAILGIKCLFVLSFYPFPPLSPPFFKLNKVLSSYLISWSGLSSSIEMLVQATLGSGATKDSSHQYLDEHYMVHELKSSCTQISLSLELS